MRFTLERVTQPEFEPITLAAAKVQLRCFASVTDQDGMITNLIKMGREWAETFTGRALFDQTWRLTVEQNGPAGGDLVSKYNGLLPPFGSGSSANLYSGTFLWLRQGEVLLRKAPVLAITSFTSVAQDGTETTIDPTTYDLREKDSKWPRIVALSGATWMNGTFRITFRAGFADTTGSPQQDATLIPEMYKQAILLWCEALYDRDPVMMPLLINIAEKLIKSESTEMGLA